MTPTALSVASASRQRLANVAAIQWHIGLSSATPEKETAQSSHRAIFGSRESSGAPDCLVSPQRGKFFRYLVEKATTPWPLRAIKEAPGRLYQNTQPF
jgi:phosphopantothenate synthetase